MDCQLISRIRACKQVVVIIIKDEKVYVIPWCYKIILKITTSNSVHQKVVDILQCFSQMLFWGCMTLIILLAMYLEFLKHCLLSSRVSYKHEDVYDC